MAGQMGHKHILVGIHMDQLHDQKCLQATYIKKIVFCPFGQLYKERIKSQQSNKDNIPKLSPELQYRL